MLPRQRFAVLQHRSPRVRCISSGRHGAGKRSHGRYRSGKTLKICSRAAYQTSYPYPLRATWPASCSGFARTGSYKATV